MTEKIISIKEDSFKINNDRWSSTYEGFIIVTDKQEIKLGISNRQSCCENWGYFMSNDSVDEFIGAKVISIETVDTCLNKKEVRDCDEGAMMFVNINTSKGTLQFTAYNEHNGYYGHDAVVISEQLNVSECL